MKKYIKDYMIRPIIEKIFVRIVIGFAVGILYMIVVQGKLQATAAFFNYPLLTAGAILLMLGWFGYLKFDGIKVNLEIDQHNKEKKKKKKSKHKTKTMIDYTDEDIRDDQPLLENEKTVCNFIANLVSGVVLIIPSIILLIIELL